ncbi:MAG: TonB-dependent receptor, partial [Cyanobacteria bacterium P01_D01_bin.73]
ETDDDVEFFNVTRPLGIRNGVGVNASGNTSVALFTDLNDDTSADLEVFSAYIQDEIEISDQLDIIVGARFDSFDISVDNLDPDVSPEDRSRSRTDEEITPRLGVVYKPMENISFYGSYSESFLPASGEQFADLERAIAATTKTFAGLAYRVVPIDFTQPEDEYTPVNYGREALINALADLLPTAEATAIHRLLDDDALSQIGGLYRGAARRYMLAFSVAAATLAAVPLPFATMPVLTTLQVSLVGLLGKLYGQTLSPSQAGGIAGAIAGGFLAQTIGRELVKFIPGFGSAIAASWAAAYTWALGEGACVYFGDLMGGKKPDPKTIQAAMSKAFKEAQERFKTQDFG